MATQAEIIKRVKELNARIARLQDTRDKAIAAYLKTSGMTWAQFNALFDRKS